MLQAKSVVKSVLVVSVVNVSRTESKQSIGPRFVLVLKARLAIA